MNEEIDLRPYVKAIIDHWRWIVGVSILAGVVTFAVLSLIPPTYEATALVAVIQSGDVVQFDNRFREGAENQPLNAFPQLALSDHVVQTLLDQNLVENVNNIESLREYLVARTGDDPSIIGLSVKSEDSVEAAKLANAWAAIFVTWANDVYNNRNDEQVQFFVDRLSEAESELVASEEALATYQAINRTRVISNTLTTYSNNHTEYLQKQKQINALIQDTGQLRDQLARQSSSNQVTIADQLTALSLQLEAYDVETSIPIQLQIDDVTSLTSNNQIDQIVLLDELLATLAVRNAMVTEELATLEPIILDLQQQQQEAINEQKRLFRGQSVAEETYLALARKAEEERITSQDTSSGVRLASEAAVPVNPADRNRMVYTAVAVIFVAMISTLIIITFTWWQSQPLALADEPTDISLEN